MAIRNKYDSVPKQTVDTIAAILKDIYLPLSMPIPSIPALAKGKLRSGMLTGAQIQTLIDTYNEVEDKYGRIRSLPEETKNFLTGLRTWRVYPDVLLNNYLLMKKYDKGEELRKFRQRFGKDINMEKGVYDEEEAKMLKRIDKITKDIDFASEINIDKLEPEAK